VIDNIADARLSTAVVTASAGGSAGLDTSCDTTLMPAHQLRGGMWRVGNVEARLDRSPVSPRTPFQPVIPVRSATGRITAPSTAVAAALTSKRHLVTKNGTAKGSSPWRFPV
jgi:hypothetical protein